MGDKNCSYCLDDVFKQEQKIQKIWHILLMRKIHMSHAY